MSVTVLLYSMILNTNSHNSKHKMLQAYNVQIWSICSTLWILGTENENVNNNKHINSSDPLRTMNHCRYQLNAMRHSLWYVGHNGFSYFVCLHWITLQFPPPLRPYSFCRNRLSAHHALLHSCLLDSAQW